MARIRTIKPEFFASERMSRLSIPARLTFIGIWTEADDWGVCRASPQYLKGHLWPFDDEVTAKAIEGHLAEMLDPCPRPVIRLFQSDGVDWLEVMGFQEHQTINRPSKRRNPTPPTCENTPSTSTLTEGSVRTHGALTEGSPMEMEMEQGTGKVSFNDTGPTYHGLSTGPVTGPPTFRDHPAGALRLIANDPGATP